MNILLNKLCTFLGPGFRAFPLIFQPFVEDGAFLLAAKVGQSKSVLNTQSPTASPQWWAHSAGSHCAPSVSLTKTSPEQVVSTFLLTDSLQTVKATRDVLQSTVGSQHGHKPGGRQGSSLAQTLPPPRSVPPGLFTDPLFPFRLLRSLACFKDPSCF